MLLNRPPLTLGPGPRGVQDARRQVAEACREIDRPELVDCAELGVSELLTNALVHGEPPVSVRVRGTVRHPRIEVADASTTAPVFPARDTDSSPEDLVTSGRGLAILERAALAWGAEIDTDSKVVWFSPANRVAEAEWTVGVILCVRHPEPPPAVDPVAVSIARVQTARLIEFQHHVRELHREVRLLATAHPEDYPLAAPYSEVFLDLEEELADTLWPQDPSTFGSGRQIADFETAIPRAATGALEQLLDLLDLLDDFIRQHRLLALARTPDQVAFHHWFLGELIRRVEGSTLG